MRVLTTFARFTDAEVARAVLEDAGIDAYVADNSAMQEMSDFRLMVGEIDLEEAAAVLEVDVPESPPIAPDWTLWAAGAVAVVILLGLVLAFL